MLTHPFAFKRLLRSISLNKKINSLFELGTYAIFLALTFVACIDESFVTPESGSLAIRIHSETSNTTRLSSADYPDNIVQSLRILTFNRSTGALVSNKSYEIANSALDVIKHPVSEGTYDMVFLANEPSDLFQGINNLIDLNGIAYPEEAFESTKNIPMLQFIENIEIASDGKAKLLNGTLTDINGKTRAEDRTEGLYRASAEDVTETLTLRLDKLAVRLDVTLKSDFDMGTDFKSITLFDLPALVPLFQKEYNLNNISRTDVPRTYNSDQFTVSFDESNGWSAKLNRIIIPSFHLRDADKNDENKGITFTVDLPDDKYSPSCKLKTSRSDDPDNYTLPYNTHLEFIGIVKKPLEVNIVAKDWDDINTDMEIGGNRVLNISQTSAGITDFNGVRISFWSNMPRVRILPKAKVNDSDVITNEAFNDLAIADGNSSTTTSTTRFFYNPKSGSGYMDIIADGGTGNYAAEENLWKFKSGTYQLILSAEDEDGSNALQREIKVTLNQEGYRFLILPWARQYTGAFFKHDQKGERIITGQHPIDKDWSVEVPGDYESWITLSSTPSFDPKAGTDDPGNPEYYTVTPNQHKEEERYTDGRIVRGKGRVYFRLGLKKNLVSSETDAPRYGYVILNYQRQDKNGDFHWESKNIYVREGEAPDYLYRSTDPVDNNPNVDDKFEPLVGQSRLAAAKFSPYNLTIPDYLESTPAYDFKQLEARKGVLVKYPTRGGAYFQWAIDLTDTSRSDFQRAAYNPANRPAATNWGVGEPSSQLIWKPTTGTSYSDLFEMCPDGYRRPTDGYVDRISHNGFYANMEGENKNEGILYSEIRSSLFKNVYAGNANAVSDFESIDPVTDDGNGTFPTGDNVRGELPGTAFGFYADGFYDRRPIRALSDVSPADGDEQIGHDHFCTAGGTSYIAYPGTLFFNTANNASLFIPAAGRIDGERKRQYRAETGYYWTSSIGPSYSEEKYGDRRISYGAWNYEISYYWMRPVLNYMDFANTIRCVADTAEPSPTP